MATIKIKMRVGSYEIEAEGPKDDVDEILTEWWKQVAGDGDNSKSAASPASAPAPRRDGVSSRKATSRIRRTAKNGVPPSASDPVTRYDANGLANKIKESDGFEQHETAILHQSDRFNKVALVCYHAGVPLTSGDIHRTLTALGVKIGLPAVSVTIKSSGNSFLNSQPRKAGTTPTYQLTGKAINEFKKVLSGSK